MKQVDIAYWGGLFDGEGCISIRLNRPTKTSKHRSHLYSLVTKVTMCDEALIRQMHSDFKVGHVGVHQRPESLKKKQRPAWSWTCMSKEAAEVVTLLRPYLRSKTLEAEIALDFMKLPSARKGRKRTDSSLIQERESFYCRLREAKGRL